MRPRISIRAFVRPSVAPSVAPSVGRSRVSQVARKWSSGNNKTGKFKYIQENSFVLTFIGRIFVRIELVSWQLLNAGGNGGVRVPLPH